MKNITPPVPIFTSASMTGTSTVTSNPQNIMYKDMCSFELDFTGTPTGTFLVQVSNSYNPGMPQSGGAANAGSWITLPAKDSSGNDPVASGSAGTLGVGLYVLQWAWVRISYTNTSGTGTLNGYFMSKSTG